jgi:hypothetical protein
VPQLLEEVVLGAHGIEIERLSRREDDDLFRKVAIVWVVETVYSTVSILYSLMGCPTHLTFDKVPQQHLDSPRPLFPTPQHVRSHQWVSFKLFCSLLGESVLPWRPSTLSSRLPLGEARSFSPPLDTWSAGSCNGWSGPTGKTLRRSVREKLAKDLRDQRRVH